MQIRPATPSSYESRHARPAANPGSLHVDLRDFYAPDIRFPSDRASRLHVEGKFEVPLNPYLMPIWREDGNGGWVRNGVEPRFPDADPQHDVYKALAQDPEQLAYATMQMISYPGHDPKIWYRAEPGRAQQWMTGPAERNAVKELLQPEDRLVVDKAEQSYAQMLESIGASAVSSEGGKRYTLEYADDQSRQPIPPELAQAEPTSPQPQHAQW